jgi:hypothetical protein
MPERSEDGVNVRHWSAPLPMSCRWCGAPQANHGQRWIRGRSWHGWEQPTRAQIEARLRVRLRRLREEREASWLARQERFPGL